MAIVKAFKALRPSRDKVHLVASRPYVTYSKRALGAKLSENPYSFIHILQPNFPDVPGKANSTERFLAVRKKYLEFIEREILREDDRECFYIYRQIHGKNTYTGLIGCASTDDYHSNVIKKHEHTLAKREKTFKHYLDTCNFNAEPVLMAYHESQSIEDIISRYTHTVPEYDFSTTDTIRHILWQISDNIHIKAIEEAFAEIQALYIADGHHRSASSALLAKERAQNNSDTDASFKRLMSYFIPHTQLSILPFHRSFRAENEEHRKTLITGIRKKYESPSGGIIMCSQGEKIKIALPKTRNKRSENLDSSLVANLILKPFCAVNDERNDTRIEHLGGDYNLQEFSAIVEKNPLKIGFFLEPVAAEELFKIADNGEFMPPKSTYVEPKLRSGITILEF